MNGVRFRSVDELLADARSRLVRLSVAEVRDAVVSGTTCIVDIRPTWQRRLEGEIPGSLIVERNHLEWRLHPESPNRLAEVQRFSAWVVVCSEGYTSSLAADALRSLGVQATDLVGGIRQWRDEGGPMVPGGTGVEQIVPVSGARRVAATGSGPVHGSARPPTDPAP